MLEKKKRYETKSKRKLVGGGTREGGRGGLPFSPGKEENPVLELRRERLDLKQKRVGQRDIRKEKGRIFEKEKVASCDDFQTTKTQGQK